MSEYRVISVPLSNDGKTVKALYIHVSGPLTEIEWQRLIDVLYACKPGLVVDTELVSVENSLGLMWAPTPAPEIRARLTEETT